jgi:ribosomal protein L34E
VHSPNIWNDSYVKHASAIINTPGIGGRIRIKREKRKTNAPESSVGEKFLHGAQKDRRIGEYGLKRGHLICGSCFCVVHKMCVWWCVLASRQYGGKG